MGSQPDPNALQNVWDIPQASIAIKPFVKLYQLDLEEQALLQQWLNGPQVEIHYELNDDTDYAIHYSLNGKAMVSRVSDCVTINGVRWHLTPGKNIIPKAVYEFILQCPEQRHRISSPVPNQANNLGLFNTSYRR